MIREWKRRLATRWLMQVLVSQLDDNTLGAGNFGRDEIYPGVWFEFTAHICPPGHRHAR